MKHLLILTSLIISGSLWADDELKTINMSLDEFEADPILKGKDMQLFILKRCAAAFDVLVEMGDDQMDETVDKFSLASILATKKIDNEGGIDRTRDQITEEVVNDREKYLDTYLNHLTAWNESIGKDSEEMFSEPFKADLRICFVIKEQLKITP